MDPREHFPGNRRVSMTAPQLVYSDVILDNGVLSLSGYGVRIAVERGHLVVEDGIGSDRRRGTFSRLDRDLTRVVVIGHAGTISLDAIRWLHGVGVPLVHLNPDGTVYLVTSPTAPSAPALRRNHARAQESAAGLEIARELLTAKMQGQLDVLGRLPHSSEAQRLLSHDIEQSGRALTLAELRRFEAHAARVYWRPWRQARVRFDAEDAKRRPRHWRVFGSRISSLTDPSPRKAVNPANAVLNYLYAILEAEARTAALAVGLDPGLGIIHSDRSNRGALACDLMEPVRPAVDRYVFELLGHRTFTKEDVFELLDGQCRLLPPLTHDLAATASEWARLVRPIAGEVADRLGGARRKRRWLGTASSEFGVRSRRRPRGPTGVTREFGGADGDAVDQT